MGNKYWTVNPSPGTGNTNSTSNWSDTDGGASGAAVPTEGDDVFINGNSGTNTITVNAAFACHSFDTTASGARTVAGSSGITVGGGATLTTAAIFKLVSNITWTNTGSITTDNRSGGVTYTMAGKTCPGGTSSSLTIASACTGATTFSDSVNTGGACSLQGTGGVTIASGTTFAAKSLAFGASNTMTLTYTGATINLTGSSTPFVAQANLTFTGGSTSQLNATAWTTGTCAFSTRSYPGTITLTSANAPAAGLTLTGAATFTNLSLIGSAASQANNMFIVVTCTVSGIFTCTGAAQRQRMLVTNANGAAFGSAKATITVNGSVSLSNVDFQCIASAGSAGTWTGTSIGDGQNTTGITMTSPVSVWWVGGTSGNFSDANKWATGSGGSAGSAGMPLPQDTATFDATSIGSNSVTITNDNLICPVLTTSAVAATGFTIQHTTGLVVLFAGNITLSSTTTVSTTSARTVVHQMYNSSSTITVVQNGGAFSATAGTSWRLCNVTVSGASTWTGILLVNDTSTFTLDISSGNVNCFGVSTSGSTTVTTSFGEFFYTCTSNLSTQTQAFNVSGGAAGKVPGLNGAQVICTNSTSNVVLIQPNVNVAIGSVTITAAGSFSITGSGGLKIDTLALFPGCSIQFPSAITFVLKQLEAIGKSGAVITITSTTGGNANTLSVAAGIINCDWLSVKDSHATGGASFFAGANSTSVSGNTGWSFTSGPARQQLSMMGCGGY